MKIAVDFGHCTSGEDRGANGYLNEEIIDREYGALVIAGLQKLGHTVYNVTPTQVGLTLSQSLAARVNMANYYGADLFLCLHVNAYQTDQGQGCEVEYISAAGKGYADNICAEIAKLGFGNRGSQLRQDLYVLKHTNMTAVLVEPFFCDNKADCALYNGRKLANAIVKGITGQDVFIDTHAVTVATGPAIPTYDETIPNGDNIFPILGKFYIEARPDGNMGIHLDRGNYIVIRKGGAPEVYYNNNNGQGGSKILF